MKKLSLLGTAALLGILCISSLIGPVWAAAARIPLNIAWAFDDSFGGDGI